VRVAPVPVLPQQRRLAGLRDWPPNARMRSLRGLGQDYTETLTFPPSSDYALPAPPAPNYPAPQAPNLPAVSPTVSAQISSAVANITPTAPQFGQPQGPIAPMIGANYTATPLPSNPLSYATPQSAIAGGANAQATYAAWTKMIATYPTQQAAIAAGIPAGVVTQLWAASRSAVAPASSASWINGSTFGIPNMYLALGFGGVALVAVMGGGRRR